MDATRSPLPSDAGDGRQVPDVSTAPIGDPALDRIAWFFARPIDPHHTRRVRLLAGIMARELDVIVADVTTTSRRQRVAWVWRRAYARAGRLDRYSLKPEQLLSGRWNWSAAAWEARRMVWAVMENLHDGRPLSLMFPLPRSGR